MIKSCQSIRFVFALMIFVHHSVLSITATGAFPVTFFLVLSGFVLMKGTNGGIEDQSQRFAFFLKRVSKIYPVHLLCLLLAISVFLLINRPIDWISLIPNVFMLQAWIPDERFFFSGNSVSWYLSVMVFCYAMFPLLAKCIKRWGWRFMVILLVVYSIAFALVPDTYVHKLIYVNPLFRIVDFCVGIWLYNLCTNGNLEGLTTRLDKLTTAKKTLIELSLILITIVFILASLKIEKRFAYACFWWIPSLLIIYLFFVFDKNGGLITKILNNRYLVVLGSLSFVFYMLHIQVLTINNYLMDNVISMNYYLNGVFVLLITTGLSYLITYYYMPLFTKSNKGKQK